MYDAKVFDGPTLIDYQSFSTLAELVAFIRSSKSMGYTVLVPVAIRHAVGQLINQETDQ